MSTNDTSTSDTLNYSNVEPAPSASFTQSSLTSDPKSTNAYAKVAPFDDVGPMHSSENLTDFLLVSELPSEQSKKRVYSSEAGNDEKYIGIQSKSAVVTRRQTRKFSANPDTNLKDVAVETVARQQTEQALPGKSNRTQTLEIPVNRGVRTSQSCDEKGNGPYVNESDSSEFDDSVTGARNVADFVDFNVKPSQSSSVNETNEGSTKKIWYRIMGHDGKYIRNVLSLEIPANINISVIDMVQMELANWEYDEKVANLSNSYAPLPCKCKDVRMNPNDVEYKTLALENKLNGKDYLHELPNGMGLSSGYFIIIKLPSDEECFLAFLYENLLPAKALLLEKYDPLTLVEWESDPFKLDQLKDRKEFLTSAYNSLYQRYTFRKSRNPPNRLNNHLTGTQGAPGSGKSAALDLLLMKSSFETIANEQEFDVEFVHQFRQALPIAITFNSGTPFSGEYETKMKWSIGIRILYYYFSGLYESGTMMTWRDWFDRCVASKFTRFLDIDGALSIVRLHRGRSKEHVLLLIDEFMILGNENVGEATKYIGQALDCDGDLHVVLSTLNMHFVNRECGGSRRAIEWIHLPALSFKSIKELFEDVRTKYKKHKLEYSLDWGLAACAGHPRTLEYFYRFVEEFSPVNVCKFATWDIFSEMFRMSVADYDSVIKVAFQGIEYGQRSILPANVDNKNHYEFDELVQIGVFINTFKTCFDRYVPRIVPWHFARSGDTNVQKFLLCCSSTAEEFNFNHYEQFHAWWEVIALWAGRLSRFVNDQQKTVQLLKLYQPQSSLHMKLLSREPLNRYILESVDETIEGLWESWGPQIVPCLKSEGVIVTSSRQNIYNVNEIFDEDNCPIPVERLRESIILSGFKTNPGLDCFSVERLANGKFVLIARELKYSDLSTKKQCVSKEKATEKYHLLLENLAPHLKGGQLYGISTLGKLKLTKNDVYLIVVSMRGDFTSFILNDHCIVLNRQIMELAYTPTLVSFPHFMVMDE